MAISLLIAIERGQAHKSGPTDDRFSNSREGIMRKLKIIR